MTATVGRVSAMHLPDVNLDHLKPHVSVDADARAIFVHWGNGPVYELNERGELREQYSIPTRVIELADPDDTHAEYDEYLSPDDAEAQEQITKDEAWDDFTDRLSAALDECVEDEELAGRILSMVQR